MSVAIPLSGKRGRGLFATVDDADLHMVDGSSWLVDREGYVLRGGRAGQATLIHRVIFGLAVGDPRQVDHIDGDPLNNQRSNLRIVTPAQQMQNKKSYRGSTSAHRGVSWNTKLQKWVAQIQANGKNKHLGCFLSEEDAARCAREARERLMTHNVEARHAVSV